MHTSEKRRHKAARSLDPIQRIAADSLGFAAAASTVSMKTPVESCPGWTVGDLVFHLLEVQWFWGEIVARRLSEPPQEQIAPERPGNKKLVDAFRTNCATFLRALSETDPRAAVWTWAPQHNVAFVVRHQVQEAAVHRWDAETAAGREFSIDAIAAVDSIEEFFTFSIPGDGPSLANTSFRLVATDINAAWQITGDATGRLAWSRSPQQALDAGLPAARGSASDLLLWLYGRVPLASLNVVESDEPFTRLQDLEHDD